MMWFNDEKQYYTSLTNKYLLYNNDPTEFDDRPPKFERNSLLNALSIGYLLNRIVILPEFSCTKMNAKPEQENTSADCSMMHYYKIATFDQQFADKYREHVFLNHPLTPEAVKRSRSRPVLIETDHINKINATFTPNKKVNDGDYLYYTPGDPTIGATTENILEWFQSMTESVLVFDSLYGVFAGFPSSKREYNNIRNSLNRAIKSSNCHQI